MIIWCFACLCIMRAFIILCHTSVDAIGTSYNVATSKVIRALDDRTYCAQSAFTHLGALMKPWRHFTVSHCVLKCALLTFSSISNRLVAT